MMELRSESTISLNGQNEKRLEGRGLDLERTRSCKGRSENRISEVMLCLGQ